MTVAGLARSMTSARSTAASGIASTRREESPRTWRPSRYEPFTTSERNPFSRRVSTVSPCTMCTGASVAFM
jgi:hypothetical protein